MTDTDTTRARFEADELIRDHPLYRNDDGHYRDTRTRQLWQLWQAAQPKWRPIAEAPRDKGAILVWCPDNRCSFTAFWSEADERWTHFWSGDAIVEAMPATHWMPLPEPPEPAPEAESTLPGLAAEVDAAGHYFEPETES